MGWGGVSPAQKAEMIRELGPGSCQGLSVWEGAPRYHLLPLLGWCSCVSSGTPHVASPLGGLPPHSSGLCVAHGHSTLTTSTLPSTQARLPRSSQCQPCILEKQTADTWSISVQKAVPGP